MSNQIGGIVDGVPESVLWFADVDGTIFADVDGTILIDTPPPQADPPMIVGGLPIVRDGFGGLLGFQRELYQTTTVANVASMAAAITLTGSTLAASFTEFDLLWGGVPQSLMNQGITVTLTTPQLASSTWYLSVIRNYGFNLQFTNTIPQQALALCLTQTTVTNSVLTTQLMIQSTLGARLYVNEHGDGASAAFQIPVSDQNGSMNS